jgi:hypothetical protein
MVSWGETGVDCEYVLWVHQRQGEEIPHIAHVMVQISDLKPN